MHFMHLYSMILLDQSHFSLSFSRPGDGNASLLAAARQSSGDAADNTSLALA